MQRGYDITEYALNCFGGAAGQHACAVADALGVRSVLVHRFSGILSAYGMGLARVRASRSQAVVQLLQQGVEKELDEVAEKLREEVLES